MLFIPDPDLPKSFLYPNLIVHRKTARGQVFRLRPGKSYPYETRLNQQPHSNRNDRFIFHEFRGRGPPPDDVGQPGDIYLDVTLPFIIYFVGNAGWEAWNRHASQGYHALAAHPIFEDRYLWVSGGMGLYWLAKSSLFGLSVTGINRTEHAMDLHMQEAIARSISEEDAVKLSLDVEENQYKNKMEVERRRHGHVPVSKIELVSAQVTVLQAQLRDAQMRCDALTSQHKTQGNYLSDSSRVLSSTSLFSAEHLSNRLERERRLEQEFFGCESERS
ncbi:hypothetical protein C8R43DRAFT_949416 [Mycena crocata]|nr:hypothetical protein C8R43DRAFT_949416 [Mycena crocata]